MATIHNPGTGPATDGRLKPLTDHERRARTEALGRALDDIAGMTDETDTDEVWRDVIEQPTAVRGPGPVGRAEIPSRSDAARGQEQADRSR